MNNNAESHLDFYRRWSRYCQPYFRWQIRQFVPYIGQRVGDVGCGLGNFAELLKDKELYLGFDTDSELLEEFRKSHKEENLRLAVHGDVCSAGFVEEAKSGRLDTMLCVNVLEHIKDDRLALANMAESINKGGHICLLIPAFNFLFGSLDALDGHFRRYTRKDIKRLMEGLPLELIKSYYLNLPGAAMWFIKGKILKEKTHDNSNYTAMNALLPLVSFIEGVIKPPFGMSLVAILRKK